MKTSPVCPSSLRKRKQALFTIPHFFYRSPGPDDTSFELQSGTLISTSMMIMSSCQKFYHLSGPTRAKAHTLDLVFTLGLTTNAIYSKDILFLIIAVFFLNSSHRPLSPFRPVVSFRIFTSSTAEKFIDSFHLFLFPFNGDDR